MVYSFDSLRDGVTIPSASITPDMLRLPNVDTWWWKCQQ